VTMAANSRACLLLRWPADVLWKTKKCSGKVVDCDDTDNRKCINPDLTKESCKQGKGDCNGYTCECSAEEKGGCAIHTAAPPGNACKCKVKSKSKCTAEVVDCKYADHNCKRPSKTLAYCKLADDGNCDGHKCSCGWRDKNGNKGCYLKNGADGKAPDGKACACTLDLDDNKKCHGEIVDCKSKKNKRCKDPDMTKASCLQAVGEGNNCEGYDDDDSVEESENGGESGESSTESTGAGGTNTTVEIESENSGESGASSTESTGAAGTNTTVEIESENGGESGASSTESTGAAGTNTTVETESTTNPPTEATTIPST